MEAISQEQQYAAFWEREIGKALLRLQEVKINLGHACIGNSIRYVHLYDDMPQQEREAIQYVITIIKQEHRSQGDMEVLRED